MDYELELKNEQLENMIHVYESENRSADDR